MTSAVAGHPPAVRAASRATFASFVANGVLVGAWTSRIPGTGEILGIDTAQIGLILLCTAVGAMLSMSQAGTFTPRWGTRRSARTGAVIAAVSLVLVAVSLVLVNVWLMAAGMLVLGMGMGLWDVSMNVEGADVEHQLGQTVMPRYHAAFSLGSVVGALSGAATAALQVPVAVGLPVVGLICIAATITASENFLSSARQSAEERAEASANPAVSPWREGRTVLIGVVVLSCALTEGSAMDWVAKGAVDGLGTSEAMGALVFSVFLASMTLTRWFSTPMVDRFGRVASLRVCLGAAFVGLALYVLAPSVPLMMAGAFLWGIGAALGFPLGISAAADDPGKAAARVGVVSVIAYGAFFLGPPVLGWIGAHWGIRPALSVLAVPLVAALALAGVTRERSHHKG